MRFAVVLLSMVLLMSGGMASAQPMDVPRDHWAYDAVQELADKGLVTGYPDGRFLGDRTMTRYEFATVIMRVLNYLDDKIAGMETGRVTIPAPTPAPVAPPTPSPAPAQPAISPQDVQMISRLVEEFKVELTVIGARLDRVESNLEDLQIRMETVEAIVTDPEGALEATRSDVSKLKKIAISGYIQNRYEVFADDVDQDGKPAVDSFNVRRARAKITAKPTDNAVGVISIGAEANKVSVKDAYLQYTFGDNAALSPSIVIGQQNWPFGYEVPYSSSRRETPERALWSRRLFPGERDRGAKLIYPISGSWLAQVGVFDGTGTGTVNTINTFVTDSTTTPPTTAKLKTSSTVARDYDEHKDIVANLQYSNNNMEFGVSGYFGRGVWNADRAATVTDVDKVRYGADFRYFWNNLTLKAEYARAKGVDEAPGFTDWLNGYYTQLNYNASVRNTLVARYESISEDPIRPEFGRRSAWHYGWVRWLDDKMKVKLFYENNREQQNAIDNDIWRLECLLSY